MGNSRSNRGRRFLFLLFDDGRGDGRGRRRGRRGGGGRGTALARLVPLEHTAHPLHVFSQTSSTIHILGAVRQRCTGSRHVCSGGIVELIEAMVFARANGGVQQYVEGGRGHWSDMQTKGASDWCWLGQNRKLGSTDRMVEGRCSGDSGRRRLEGHSSTVLVVYVYR